MPRKGKGSKVTSFKPSSSSEDCAVCGYPKKWKVHNHG